MDISSTLQASSANNVQILVNYVKLLLHNVLNVLEDNIYQHNHVHSVNILAMDVLLLKIIVQIVHLDTI